MLSSWTWVGPEEERGIMEDDEEDDDADDDEDSEVAKDVDGSEVDEWAAAVSMTSAGTPTEPEGYRYSMSPCLDGGEGADTSSYGWHSCLQSITPSQKKLHV